MYIERVHIQDLRCFADATIEFEHPDRESSGPLRNVTLLLGNNGVGKTTVLRAVALGALHHALTQSGYVPYSMIRRASQSPPHQGQINAQLIAHGQDLDGQLSARSSPGISGSVTVLRMGDVETFAAMSAINSEVSDAFQQQLYSETSAGVLVLGYGSTRRIDPASEFSRSQRRRLRVLRYDRVANLFEEQLSLAPLAAWLPEFARIKPKLYIRVCDLLERLIPADTRFTGELEGDEYLFERGGIKVGFAALSDGYRGYIGLLGDIFTTSALA